MDFYCNSCNIGFQWIWNNKIWRLWIRWNDEHDVRKLRKRHDVFRLDLRNPHNCGTCVPDNLVMAANTKSEKKIMVNKEKINGKIIISDLSFGKIGNIIYHKLEPGNSGMYTFKGYKKLFNDNNFKNIRQERLGLTSIYTEGRK